MDILKDWVLHGKLQLKRNANSQVPGFPIRLAAFVQDGGGTLNGTYYYKVQATDSTPEWGHLWGSEEKSAVVALGRQVALSWTTIPTGATFYVYRTTTPGSYSANSLIATTTAIDYIDTGGSSSSGTPGSADETLDLRDLNSPAAFVCITQTTVSTYDLTGIAGGVDGRVMILFSENINSLVRIRNEHILATAANRIKTLRGQSGSFLADSNSRDIDLAGQFVAVFVYNAELEGSGRWIYVASQGKTSS